MKISAHILKYRQHSRQETLLLYAFCTEDRRRLDVDEFPVFSGGGTWQGFCRDLDHPYVGFSYSGLSA